MTVETAQSLARTLDRNAFGPPTRALLHQPVPALYFAAALLEDLASFGDCDASVAFTVQAYIAGAHPVFLQRRDSIRNKHL